MVHADAFDFVTDVAVTRDSRRPAPQYELRARIEGVPAFLWCKYSVYYADEPNETPITDVKLVSNPEQLDGDWKVCDVPLGQTDAGQDLFVCTSTVAPTALAGDDKWQHVVIGLSVKASSRATGGWHVRRLSPPLTLHKRQWSLCVSHRSAPASARTALASLQVGQRCDAMCASARGWAEAVVLQRRSLSDARGDGATEGAEAAADDSGTIGGEGSITGDNDGVDGDVMVTVTFLNYSDAWDVEVPLHDESKIAPYRTYTNEQNVKEVITKSEAAQCRALTQRMQRALHGHAESLTVTQAAMTALRMRYGVSDTSDDTTVDDPDDTAVTDITGLIKEACRHMHVLQKCAREPSVVAAVAVFVVVAAATAAHALKTQEECSVELLHLLTQAFDRHTPFAKWHGIHGRDLLPGAHVHNRVAGDKTLRNGTVQAALTVKGRLVRRDSIVTTQAAEVFGELDGFSTLVRRLHDTCVGGGDDQSDHSNDRTSDRTSEHVGTHENEEEKEEDEEADDEKWDTMAALPALSLDGVLASLNTMCKVLPLLVDNFAASVLPAYCASAQQRFAALDEVSIKRVDGPVLSKICKAITILLGAEVVPPSVRKQAKRQSERTEVAVLAQLCECEFLQPRVRGVTALGKLLQDAAAKRTTHSVGQVAALLDERRADSSDWCLHVLLLRRDQHLEIVRRLDEVLKAYLRAGRLKERHWQALLGMANGDTHDALAGAALDCALKVAACSSGDTRKYMRLLWGLVCQHLDAVFDELRDEARSIADQSEVLDTLRNSPSMTRARSLFDFAVQFTVEALIQGKKKPKEFFLLRWCVRMLLRVDLDQPSVDSLEPVESHHDSATQAALHKLLLPRLGAVLQAILRTERIDIHMHLARVCIGLLDSSEDPSTLAAAIDVLKQSLPVRRLTEVCNKLRPLDAVFKVVTAFADKDDISVGDKERVASAAATLASFCVSRSRQMQLTTEQCAALFRLHERTAVRFVSEVAKSASQVFDEQAFDAALTRVLDMPVEVLVTDPVSVECLRTLFLKHLENRRIATLTKDFHLCVVKKPTALAQSEVARRCTRRLLEVLSHSSPQGGSTSTRDRRSSEIADLLVSLLVAHGQAGGAGHVSTGAGGTVSGTSGTVGTDGDQTDDTGDTALRTYWREFLVSLLDQMDAVLDREPVIDASSLNDADTDDTGRSAHLQVDTCAQAAAVERLVLLLRAFLERSAALSATAVAGVSSRARSGKSIRLSCTVHDLRGSGDQAVGIVDGSGSEVHHFRVPADMTIFELRRELATYLSAFVSGDFAVELWSRQRLVQRAEAFDVQQRASELECAELRLVLRDVAPVQQLPDSRVNEFLSSVSLGDFAALVLSNDESLLRTLDRVQALPQALLTERAARGICRVAQMLWLPQALLHATPFTEAQLRELTPALLLIEGADVTDGAVTDDGDSDRRDQQVARALAQVTRVLLAVQNAPSHRRGAWLSRDTALVLCQVLGRCVPMRSWSAPRARSLCAVLGTLLDACEHLRRSECATVIAHVLTVLACAIGGDRDASRLLSITVSTEVIEQCFLSQQLLQRLLPRVIDTDGDPETDTGTDSGIEDQQTHRQWSSLLHVLPRVTESRVRLLLRHMIEHACRTVPSLLPHMLSTAWQQYRSLQGQSFVREFFALLLELLALSEGMEESQRYGCFGTRDAVLAEAVERLQQHLPHEVSLNGKEDSLLQGRLSLVHALIEPADLESMEAFVCDTVLRKCLFAMPSALVPRHRRQLDVQLPLCETTASRNVAWRLLARVLTFGGSSAVEQQYTTLLQSHLRQLLRPMQWQLPSGHLDMTGGSRSGRPSRSANSSADSSVMSSYAGLRNMGCTCYMNALLQQLFLLPAVRNAVLGMDLELPGKEVDETHRALARQLQALFAQLRFGESGVVDTRAFCRSLLDWEGQPVDVSQQMDTSEFAAMLFDRVDRLCQCLGLESPFAACAGQVAEHFQADQEAGQEGQEAQIRLKLEPFYFLPLEVKQLRSLHESLRHWSSGERLEGVYWPKVDKKIDSTRCATLHRLPRVLLVQLKRFEFDLERLCKVKLNSEFEFPRQLDLEPFTLRSSSLPLPKSDDSDVVMDTATARYTLTGVVVHMGAANSGHYYSFARDCINDADSADHDNNNNSDSDSDRWIELNDDRVLPFDPSLIDQECYGGEENIGDTKHKTEKTRSAFVLVYTALPDEGHSAMTDDTSIERRTEESDALAPSLHESLLQEMKQRQRATLLLQETALQTALDALPQLHAPHSLAMQLLDTVNRLPGARNTALLDRAWKEAHAHAHGWLLHELAAQMTRALALSDGAAVSDDAATDDVGDGEPRAYLIEYLLNAPRDLSLRFSRLLRDLLLECTQSEATALSTALTQIVSLAASNESVDSHDSSDWATVDARRAFVQFSLRKRTCDVFWVTLTRAIDRMIEVSDGGAVDGFADAARHVSTLLARASPLAVSALASLLRLSFAAVPDGVSVATLLPLIPRARDRSLCARDCAAVLLRLLNDSSTVSDSTVIDDTVSDRLKRLTAALETALSGVTRVADLGPVALLVAHMCLRAEASARTPLLRLLVSFARRAQSTSNTLAVAAVGVLCQLLQCADARDWVRAQVMDTEATEAAEDTCRDDLQALLLLCERTASNVHSKLLKAAFDDDSDESVWQLAQSHRWRVRVLQQPRQEALFAAPLPASANVSINSPSASATRRY